MRTGLFVAIASMLLTTQLNAQQERVPAGMTLEQVRAGLDLYHGKGACALCHGDFGLGTPDGPALTEGPWKLGAGGYDWLLHMTRHAGWGAVTREGDPQPMRGPTVLDSAEVASVAAYVWTISRGRGGQSAR